MTGRLPDYRIKALNKDTDERDYIGAAWQNDDGSIGLKFNPFVVVPVGSDFAITLFPQDDSFVTMVEERPRDGKSRRGPSRRR